jgi:tetratricopeptide (TPR) repeat protein
MNERDLAKINGLMNKIIDEDDDERRSSLADELLSVDPANPIAKYIKWQSSDYEESLRNVEPLREAIDALRPIVGAADDDDYDEGVRSFFLAMLSDLASFQYAAGEHEQAMEAATEFMAFDRDGFGLARIVYYAMLVERREFEAVIETADSDICESPIGAYCKSIASFELEGDNAETVELLLNAFSLDPDMPFYFIGFWSLDEEDIEEDDDDGFIEETIFAVSVLSELWSATDERLAFLGGATFAFGYLTGRMSSAEDVTMLESSYRDAGCLEDMRETRDVLQAMLAAGRDQAEVDDEALAAFRRAGFFGLFE